MSEYIQPYDFAMLAVLVGAVIYGAWKGFAWQLASLASIGLSAAVAVQGGASLAPYFNVSEHEEWNRFLAMFVLYVVTAGAIWLLFRLVSGAINRVQLKEFDRQLGIIFGIAKGVLYCIVITFFAVTLSEGARQLVLQSRSGDLIARLIRNANPILPEDIREWLGKYIDELDEKLRTPPQEVSPGSKTPTTSPQDTSPKPKTTAPSTESSRGGPPKTTSENATPRKWFQRLQASSTRASNQPAPTNNLPSPLAQ